MFDNIEKRKIKSVQREEIVVTQNFVNDGFCLARDSENKVLLIRYAMPGEKLRVNIYKEAKDYALAEPIEIIEASPERINPACKYFALCGGCDLQMAEYDVQLKYKLDILKETFKRIGSIDINEFNEVIKSPKPFYYRNTVTFKVHTKKKNIGFFRKDTKNIIDIDNCMLAMENINKALSDIKNQENFPPHNFKVRTTCDNETSVHWIETELYEDKDLYETITVDGKSIKFKISKDSFFQINNYVIPLWLEKIISFLKSDKSERVFDLYCGIGLITLFVSYYAKETVGVEIAKSSVKDGNFNIKNNNIDTNVKILLSSVEDIIETLGYADVVIVDPPRKGLDNKTKDILKSMGPSKIIYSSCKAATMARDIAELRDLYDVKEIIPIDMFPQTHHIEVLCLLIKKEG